MSQFEEWAKEKLQLHRLPTESLVQAHELLVKLDTTGELPGNWQQMCPLDFIGWSNDPVVNPIDPFFADGLISDWTGGDKANFPSEWFKCQIATICAMTLSVHGVLTPTGRWKKSFLAEVIAARMGVK